MRGSKRLVLLVSVLAAFGVFFQFFPAFSYDEDGIVAIVEYKLMLRRQKDLFNTRQRILLTDENLAMPKVLDDNPKERQRLVNSLLGDIIAYERACIRYNTDMEWFGKRFRSLVSSSRAIGLDPCRHLSISWGK